MHGVVRVGTGPLVGVVGAPQLASGSEPVQLALFLDAGSRDAQAPEAATLAAWLLAEQVGRNARGRAFPDGIEVIAPCPDGLQPCVQRLARGLALRAPTPAALSRATHALIREQRESLARDRGRNAEQLAVEALWPDAEGFFPLEHAGGSAKQRLSAHGAIAAAVRAFIADAFGPERALIVASGPVEAQRLAQLAADSFARAPRANAQRATRDDADLRDDVAVDVDAQPRLSIALGADTVRVAAAAAEALRSELLHDARVTHVSGNAMSVRGGALAVLRVALREPREDSAAVVKRVGAWVARTRHEGLPEAPRARLPSAPLDAMRYLGLRFAAGANDDAVHARGLAQRQTPDTAQSAHEDEGRVRLHVGIGALVQGGRADRVAVADPDAALRRAATERLRAALEEGQRLATPALTGDYDDERADVTLENGSRIVVRSTLQEDQAASEDASVAIAISFARGAVSDPPAQHGRAALLASVMATACAGRTPDALSAELAGMNARIEPFVSAQSLGIALEVPASAAHAAIALATECALSPSLERGHVTLARLRLRERLGRISDVQRAAPDSPETHVLEGRAAVARALALQQASFQQASAGATPAATNTDLLGAIAPWGSGTTLPSVDERALSELMGAALRGPSTTVAIAGAVPAQAAALWAARRVSALGSVPALASAPVLLTNRRSPAAQRKPAGRALKKDPLGRPTPQADPPTLPPNAVEALVVFQTATASAQTAHADAARAFAAGLALGLQAAGLRVAWLGGDCAAGTAWAAAVVRAPADQLATLSTSLAGALKGMQVSDLVQAAERAQSRRPGPSLIERAQGLAERALQTAPPVGTAQALIEGLRAAPPLVVPTP